MPLEIIRNDITKVHADAIVNAANSALQQGGGVCGAIFKAAGEEDLQKACDAIGGCRTGEAVITGAFALPAKYIIHTVGPVWKDGSQGEELQLADCYTGALSLALQNGLESIAFPLISSGIFRFPKDKALKIAISTIGDFLLKNDMLVYLVVFDKSAYALSEKLFSSIRQYIDDHYIEEYDFGRYRNFEVSKMESPSVLFSIKPSKPMESTKRSLADVVRQRDESFSQSLLRIIDEKGKSDVEVYKKANIDRKLFSKIRSDIQYNASKRTVIAFSVALELNLDETRDLLGKAGFALSHSSVFDIIIEYYIENENYNIFELNEALFAFDQPLLGA